MTGLNANATFDCLYITHALEAEYEGATQPEFHAISYLACLLSVYRGRPAASWGYEFVANGAQSPFSEALLDAQAVLVGVGALKNSAGDRFGLTSTGVSRLSQLARMHQFESRQIFLRGAVDAAHAMPLPALQSAVRREPQLALASMLSVPQRLLDEVGLGPLHRDFEALAGQFSDLGDLVVPAVVWLSFLLQQETDSFEVRVASA